MSNTVDTYIARFATLQDHLPDPEEQELALIDEIGRDYPEAPMHDICSVVAFIKSYCDSMAFRTTTISPGDV